MKPSARWMIALWLVLLVACSVVIARTKISTDLSAFLPKSPTPIQQVLVEQLREGVLSRLILIAIEGADVQARARASKSLAAALRKGTDFVSVDNGEDVGGEGSAAEREFLWRNRYLLSPAVTPAHFTAAGLRTELEAALQTLGSPAGMLLRKVLPNDPSGELMRLIDDIAGQTRPAMQEGVWFSADGKRALLVAQTRAAGFDIDAQALAMHHIQSAFAVSAGQHAEAGGARLLMSGPGIFSVSSRNAIKGDAWRLSAIATVLIVFMLLALYRSPRVLVLGLLPVASGAAAGVAAVSLGFGSVHGITLGFGVTLIGEGVDYAIYLFTQIAPGVPPQRTLKRIWPTLRLGVLTSICGYAAMLSSGFPGLAQLGLFSIAGLLGAVSVARWVLPALLPAGFAAHAVDGLAPVVARTVERAPGLRWAVPLVIVLAAATLILQRDGLWRNDIGSLSPVSAADQALDETLRGDLGAPDVGHLIVIRAADEQTALQDAERVGTVLRELSAKGALAGFDSPATVLPSRKAQATRQAALPESNVLRAALEQAVQGLPFRTNLFAPFLRDVETARTQPLLDRSSLAGTHLALKLDSLLIKRSDGGWTAMLPLRNVKNESAIVAALPGGSSSQTMLLDLKRESDDLYRGYLDEARRHSALGAAAIVVLLAFSLRSPRRAFRVLVPLVAAVLVVTAVLVAAGHRLTIFHLVGLLLVVAVGSNYALFFERPSASASDRGRTLVSLLFANLSTVLGFGLLSFSSVPLLKAIGVTVGSGAILSLVFSAIWMGRGRGDADGAEVEAERA